MNPLLAGVLVDLLIGTAIQVVGFYLLGQGNKQKPEQLKDMKKPTSEGGIPIPVVFGEVDIASPNCIWEHDRQTIPRKVNL
jgi:uncharacterized membrane protein